MIRLPALARSTHKWLALFVGLQAVLWTAGGIYMTAVHIDIIHGDRLVKAAPQSALALTGLVEPAHLAHLAPGLKSARLETQLGRAVYVVDASDGKALFDARTGEKLSPLGKAGAEARAKALFAESGAIVSAEYLTKAPLEMQTRPVPVWRVEFEGAWRPTFYISPYTGELVTRRHDLWRLFDVVWMLHIMDYDDRQDVNNVLLQGFTWLAVLGSATGGWLLLYSFRRRRRRKAA
ncbi:PepSY domain-containing protein [Phenylobacterium sp.]|uniref:PepSY domain-containing protein n=1 Tax=Phenylobacterium sp. TaxID=1871053 RepID=UPI0025E39440|nr:PepSY domain-containing protein [Phenylobacterium sp.]